MYRRIGFHERDAWRTAPAVYDGHSLTILDHPVMADWEEPYMAALAGFVTSGEPGKRVLEVGFGMGISAKYIAASPNVEQHIIVEANRDVAGRARDFRDNAGAYRGRPETRIIEGLWEDVIDEIEDGSLDGILYDAYPLEPGEVMNQARFAATAYRKLRRRGRFTYFSDEPERFGRRHLRTLLKAGFDRANIQSMRIAVDPPAECGYWKSQTIIVPKLIK